MTQTVAKEPHGKELHVVLSAGLATGPGLLRNFPREGPATLLSAWGEAEQGTLPIGSRHQKKGLERSAGRFLSRDQFG